LIEILYLNLWCPYILVSLYLLRHAEDLCLVDSRQCLKLILNICLMVSFTESTDAHSILDAIAEVLHAQHAFTLGSRVVGGSIAFSADRF
jgi:hypothetical protein